ncbi:hypothetical protein [Acidovorax sp. FG27]|uniref:hypothetical protein n=1 Tax=Acidovorax sp. FG27 TaxID=3133652 RepID=UPI0030E961B4
MRYSSSQYLSRVISYRGHGQSEEFHLQADGSYTSFDSQVTLQKTDSTVTPWKRLDYDAGEIELYDALGRLLSLRYFGGGGFDMVYVESQLHPLKLVSSTGHEIHFEYSDDRLIGIRQATILALALTYKVESNSSKNIFGTYLSKSLTLMEIRLIFNIRLE